MTRQHTRLPPSPPPSLPSLPPSLTSMSRRSLSTGPVGLATPKSLVVFSVVIHGGRAKADDKRGFHAWRGEREGGRVSRCERETSSDG